MPLTPSSTKPPIGSKASKPACRNATSSKIRPTCRGRRIEKKAVITSGRGLASGEQRRDPVPESPLARNATKLDLAAAYEEIGDKEGARELLQEVVKGGDSDQQQKARTMLSKIS